MNAFDQGTQAYTKGLSLLDNPFHIVDNADNYDEWAIGYMEAEYESIFA